MKRLVLLAAALFAGVATVYGQVQGPAFELRPYAGASIPTGTQRDLFKSAPMVGLQAAYELRPTLHFVASFGWIPGQNKYPVANDNVNVFQYDAGLELDLVRPLSDTWLFKPFIGAGAGARSYVYQDAALNDQTCFAGYGAAGTEFQTGVIALRLEARDNLYCYKSPVANVDSKNRNDLSFLFGVAYHFR